MNENMKSIDVIMCTYNSRRRELLSFALEEVIRDLEISCYNRAASPPTLL
jgi:hypothetical protein